MAGYKESLDSLRLLNHPHIKPGLHYRALKDANQSLWLRSASLALAVASFSGSGCGQPLWLRAASLALAVVSLSGCGHATFGSAALSSYPNHS